MSNTNWADSNINDTNWARASGIDTNVPTYNDFTISYSDPLTYYNGYNANTITEDDVHFTAYVNTDIPPNTGWSAAT